MKTRLLIIFAIGMIGFSGVAFASHDPNQSLEHSIILPPEIKEKSFEEFMAWCMPLYEDLCANLEKNRIPIILSPLKQIKSGIALFDVQCSDEKRVIYKHDRMRAACVTSSTYGDLIERGWAALRLETHATNDVGRDLCNLYEGQWESRHGIAMDCNIQYYVQWQVVT